MFLGTHFNHCSPKITYKLKYYLFCIFVGFTFMVWVVDVSDVQKKLCFLLFLTKNDQNPDLF